MKKDIDEMSIGERKTSRTVFHVNEMLVVYGVTTNHECTT